MKYFIYFEYLLSSYPTPPDWQWMMRDFDDICVAKSALDRMRLSDSYRNVSDILMKYQEP